MKTATPIAVTPCGPVPHPPTIYPSQRVAARALGISQSTVSVALARGKRIADQHGALHVVSRAA